MHDTLPLLVRTDFPPIRRHRLDTLQVNLGYKCNQSCLHCHVNAGPNRTEMMDADTTALVLQVLRARRIGTLDLTGGAPELNEHFRHLVVEARALGVAQTTRIFDGRPVADASRELRSPHFGARVTKRPGAFVYTEVQVGVPFEQAPWQELNRVLAAQPGLLHKTWLAGVGTHSLGGFYAFESIAHAREFALVYFPTETAKLGAAYTTRLFDAAVVAEARKH